MKEGKWDKLKSPAQLKKELGKTCQVPGCCEPLSHVKGPGSERFCREHMLSQFLYGGMSGHDLHTYHRKEACEICGYNPSEDTAWIHYHYKEDDPDLFNQLKRARLEVNHIDGNHLNNDPSNLQTVCGPCHRDITIIEQHYLTRR